MTTTPRTSIITQTQIEQMERITSIFGKIEEFNSKFTSRKVVEMRFLSSDLLEKARYLIQAINLLPELEEIKENIHPKNAHLLDKGMKLIQTFQENISIYNNTLPTAVTELVEKIKITDNKIQDLINREESANDFYVKTRDVRTELDLGPDLVAHLRRLDATEEYYKHYITAQYDKSMFKNIDDQLKEVLLHHEGTLLRALDKKLMIVSDEVDNCGNEMKLSGITIDNFKTMIDKTKTLLAWIVYAIQLDYSLRLSKFYPNTLLPFVNLKNSISTCNDALSKAEALKNGSKGRIVEAILLPRFQDEIEHTLIYCYKNKALYLNLNTLLEISKQVKNIIHIAQHENENNHNQNENNTLEEEIKLCRLQLKEEQNAYDDVNNFIDEIKVVGVTDDAKAQKIQTALQKYKKNTEDLISDLGELDKKTVNKEDKKLIKTSIEASEQFIRICNSVIEIAKLYLNLNTLLETSKQVKDIIHIAQHENENNHNQNENNTLEEEIKLCRFQLIEEQDAAYDDVNNFIDEIKVVGVTDAQKIQTALQKYKKNTEDLISDLGELDKKTVNKEDKKLIKTLIEASEQFIRICNSVIEIANRYNHDNKKPNFRLMMGLCNKNAMKKLGSSLHVVIKSFGLIVPTANEESRNDERKGCLKLK